MTSIERGKGTGTPEPAYYENAPSGASMEAIVRGAAHPYFNIGGWHQLQ